MFKINLLEASTPYTYLKKQAHIDLTLRARGGMFIYFFVWLITAFWAGINQKDMPFFVLNTVIFLAVMLVRLVHYNGVTKDPKFNTNNMYKLLVASILTSASHWGLLSAYIIYSGNYQGLHYPYMIIIAAFAIGGSGVLSISRLISILFPMLIFIPTFIYGAIVGGMENYVLLTLGILSILYVLEASRVSHNDYHKAIFSHRVAENRAVKMEQLSITDQLTSLKNRMYFNQKLTDMWSCCSKYQVPLSIIMIDLDHFKKINDTYGHIAGDDCLKKVAKVLKFEMRRSTDVVARFGGEEFIVLLPEANLQTTTKIANRLLLAIAKIDLILDENPVTVSCSIGVSSAVPHMNINEKDLVVAADNAMYKAKQNGRNQCCVAEELSINLEI